MGGALTVKYSEYFGAKGCESFKLKVFWRQKARVSKEWKYQVWYISLSSGVFAFAEVNVFGEISKNVICISKKNVQVYLMYKYSKNENTPDTNA